MASSRVCPMFLYKCEVIRIRYWSNCGFPKAEAALGERGVTRPLHEAGHGGRGGAASRSGGLSIGSLSGDATSRARTADSVTDIAKTLLELSQRSDECFKRLMDVHVSARDLEDPPVESASDARSQVSQHS